MSSYVEVRPGAYHDSVSLMRISNTVAARDGVSAAFTAMATEPNRELAGGMGFELPDGVGPNDLLVTISADDEATLERAREALDAALEGITSVPDGQASGPSGGAPAPRTVGAAAARTDATLALVSVPGEHAFTETMDALESGLSVILFSDNVPVEQEIRLKDEAGARDLLVMGPDCGTAVVGGLGFGFANVTRPGSVGIVGASGTGSQELLCLLDAAGVGVSHCLGVGGRDLSEQVGGRATKQAMAALDADPATDLIVVVSKPPAAGIADEVRAFAGQLTTPTRFALLGPDQPDLTRVAADVAGTAWATPARWEAVKPGRPRPGALRGLFCGGTLCDEAMAIAAETLGPIASNTPLEPAWALGDDLRTPVSGDADAHVMIDFGDDRFTLGRPHPMIDPAPRLERFAEEVADPATGAVLLDVVLGYGSHADPATDLAAAIRDARERGHDVPVVISLTGTEGDPQGLTRQVSALAEAGADVFLSNAEAARRATSAVSREAPHEAPGTTRRTPNP